MSGGIVMNVKTSRKRETDRRPNSNRKAGGGYRLTRWLVLGLLVLCVASGFLFLNRSPDQQTIRIASGPYRSDSYELMREIADVVSRHSEWLKIEVVATRDSSRNTTMLN